MKQAEKPAPLVNKGSRENGVNAVTGRGYNPSVFSACETSRKASSPSIRSEAPSFIVARAAKPLVFGAKHQTQNVVRQSRTNILPKIHRGAEKRRQLLLCTSTHTAFAHTRCISPSVFLRPLGTKIHLPPQREARALPRRALS